MDKKNNLEINFTWLAVLAVVLFASLIFGVVVSGKTNLVLTQKQAETEEAKRPADLAMTIITDQSCEDCFSLSSLLQAIKEQNVNLKSEQVLDASSDEAAGLIADYKIQKLPTVLVSGEISKEKSLHELWPKLGEVVGETFVLRQSGFPYVEVISGKVRGRVEVILLADSSCAECYDVTQHEVILQQAFGIPTENARALDVSFGEGRELRNKYNITLAPTVIIKGDTEAYVSLKPVWPQVGTIEDDGAYVFREGVKRMGVYKDLTTGKVVDPASD